MLKKVGIGLAVGAAALLAPAHAADIDDWPNRNITVVVPYPAGGSADIMGRLVAKVITDATGNTAIVENISGGATIPGARAGLREPSDGQDRKSTRLNSSHVAIS